MARYGEFKYGSSTPYGLTDADPALLSWILLVDWDGDGAYDADNEADRMTAMKFKTGREDYLSASGSGFEAMRPAVLTVTLDDYDRRYDPRYASSPLYPSVSPGKKFYLGVMDNSTQTTYTIFTGILDDIIPVVGVGQNRSVRLVGKSYLQLLMDLKLSSRTERTATTISAAFDALLDDANFPGTRAIDADAQPVTAFVAQNKRAAETAKNLADACLGHFFVDRYGRAVFYARNHSYSSVASLEQSELLNEIGLSLPWEGRYNQVLVVANRKLREQPCIIFSQPHAEPSDGDDKVFLHPRYGAATDIAISKITFNSAANGTGTARTGAADSGNFLGPTGGELVYTLSGAGYLTKLEIRGRKWTEAAENYYSPAYGSVSGALNLFTLDTPMLQDKNYARAFAAVLDDFLDDDRESLVVRLENRFADQFTPELLDVVTVTIGAMDISAVEYHVMGIEHTWLNSPNSVRTTLYLHRIVTNSDSITAAPSEEIPAPKGLNDPGGDEDTIDATTEERNRQPFRIKGNWEDGGTQEFTIDGDDIVNWGAAPGADRLLDPAGMYDDSQEDRVTIPAAGIYKVDLSSFHNGCLYTLVTPGAEWRLMLYNSAGEVKKTGPIIGWEHDNPLLSGGPYVTDTMASGFELWECAVGDYIQVESYGGPVSAGLITLSLAITPV